MTYYAIPHSHTDAGWWLTFDTYYQHRASPILNTLHTYLSAKYLTNTSATNGFEERFVWADFAYFLRWWRTDATADVQRDMKELVRRGILSLEHGGMVQHDEALTDYKSITLMFDSSLQFIKEEFGTLPRVGFSIDAFGHSSLTPYLFKALGLEALLVYRMPYYLYEGLARRNQYFFTWEGDNHERIRTYRLKDYAIIEKFNLDHI